MFARRNLSYICNFCNMCNEEWITACAYCFVSLMLIEGQRVNYQRKMKRALGFIWMRSKWWHIQCKLIVKSCKKDFKIEISSKNVTKNVMNKFLQSSESLRTHLSPCILLRYNTKLHCGAWGFRTYSEVS